MYSPLNSVINTRGGLIGQAAAMTDGAMAQKGDYTKDELYCSILTGRRVSLP